MNCPKCKNDLRTKRTLADGPLVRRERYCENCNMPHWTVEIFQEHADKEKQNNNARFNTLMNEKYDLERELNRIKQGLKAFKMLIDVQEKEPIRPTEETDECDFVECSSCGRDFQALNPDGLCKQCED